MNFRKVFLFWCALCLWCVTICMYIIHHFACLYISHYTQLNSQKLDSRLSISLPLEFPHLYSFDEKLGKKNSSSTPRSPSHIVVSRQYIVTRRRILSYLFSFWIFFYCYCLMEQFNYSSEKEKNRITKPYTYPFKQTPGTIKIL